jgi:hypothetical protein
MNFERPVYWDDYFIRINGSPCDYHVRYLSLIYPGSFDVEDLISEQLGDFCLQMSAFAGKRWVYRSSMIRSLAGEFLTFTHTYRDKLHRELKAWQAYYTDTRRKTGLIGIWNRFFSRLAELSGESDSITFDSVEILSPYKCC